MAVLKLPFPPSANRYWRHVGTKVLISAEGRKYRLAVEAAFRKQFTITSPTEERLAVSLLAVMPDRKRRDLDNLLKATLDALTAAGVWGDDSQIDRLEVIRGPVVAPGHLEIRIERAGSSQAEIKAAAEKLAVNLMR